jgi:hypothetical protein
MIFQSVLLTDTDMRTRLLPISITVTVDENHVSPVVTVLENVSLAEVIPINA